jgi:hypothetical protein
MSKLVKAFAIAALLAGSFAMAPTPAAAQHHWHGGGGHWHGGGYYRGGGWGWGPGPFWGWGVPYAYYGGPACGWHSVRVWRGRWVLRRAWRCY